MSDEGVLDSTAKIRERLELEYHIVGRVLMDKIFKCLGYKTTSHRPENRNPSVCPQWEHFDSVIDFRESLNYRIGSLVWHCRQFPQHHKEHVERISELRVSGKEHHNEMREAHFTASYLLDDVVFCSVSVFDYLAQLLFKLNYPERRGKKFWNDLVKVKDHEDEKLGELIRTTHDEFVYGLSRLRGRSIHTQADVGGLELEEHFTDNGISHSFNFIMPEEAIKFISFFDDARQDFPIEPGSYLIALHTIVAARDILSQLGNYEYECLYDHHEGINI